MAKRRTRKQKEKAKHAPTFRKPLTTNLGTLQPKQASDEAAVKGQFLDTKTQKKHKDTKENIATYTDKTDNLALIKKNIVKSVIMASLILSLELMIYLIWR